METKLQELKSLLAEQQSVERRISRLVKRARSTVERLQIAEKRLSAALQDQTQSTEKTSQQVADHFQARLDDITSMGEQIKDRAETQINSIGSLNLSEFAEDLKEVVAKERGRVEGEVLDNFEMLINDQLNDCMSVFENSRTDLTSEWTEITNEFDGLKIEWTDRLETLKQELTDQFETFTEEDIEQVLEAAAETLFAEYEQVVARIAQRASHLVDKVEILIERIKKIQKLFSETRETANVAKGSAGTGLEMVAGILLDLKAILESVG